MKKWYVISFFFLIGFTQSIALGSIASTEFLTIEWMTENADTILIGEIKHVDETELSLRMTVEVQSYIKSKPKEKTIIIRSGLEANSWSPTKGETCVFYLKETTSYQVLSEGAGIFLATSNNYPIPKSMSLLQLETMNYMEETGTDSQIQYAILACIIGFVLIIYQRRKN